MNPLERLKTLSPRGQLLLALACVVVLGVGMVATYLALRPRYEVLFSDLRPMDAATIVADLDTRKIPYRLEDDGATILAPAEQVDATRLAVMSSDLPLKGSVGFELFNRTDMGVTDFAQKINYQRALQGELARTIMTLDAIESARVHLTLSEPTIFRADRRPPKASVTLSPRPGRALMPETVQGIQRLVAAAVADLEVANVVILDAAGRPVSGALTTDTVPARLQKARAVEQFYAAQIRDALATIHPDIAVEVAIPADQWAAAGATARDAALASWTPSGRAFRLRTEVSSPQSLDAEDQAEIGTVIADTLGMSEAGTDTVLFVPWREATPQTLGPEPVHQTPPVAAVADDPLDRIRPAILIAIVAMAMIGLGIAVLRRLRPRRLNPGQRDDYVRRLKRLLDEEAADAPSGL